MTDCTCNRCGWVHFAVTREFAKTEAAKFMTYYAELSEQEQKDFYGENTTYKSVLSRYERCFFCGQTDGDFRKSKDKDCPRGCTIQPTIWEPDDEG